MKRGESALLKENSTLILVLCCCWNTCRTGFINNACLWNMFPIYLAVSWIVHSNGILIVIQYSFIMDFNYNWNYICRNGVRAIICSSILFGHSLRSSIWILVDVHHLWMHTFFLFHAEINYTCFHRNNMRFRFIFLISNSMFRSNLIWLKLTMAK